MYRFPKDLDLSSMVGASLQQICIGPSNVQFGFTHGIRITLESKATILRSGKLATSWDHEKGWSGCEFQQLMNKRVVGYSVIDEKLMEIMFSDEWVVHFFDDSDGYESLQIHGLEGGQTVIV